MYYKKENAIYIFGGQQELLGTAGSTNSVRDLQNDFWKIELNTGLYERVELECGAIARRIYSTGFMISQYFFIMGGMSIDGVCLNDVLMFDIERKKGKILDQELNRSLHLLKPLCSSACVSAYFSSRYDTEGVNLDLEKVCKDIDWSTALSMIKYEGVYMFGGRDDKNNATNRLLCINIKKSIVTA